MGQAGLPDPARINDGNDLANLIAENDIGFASAGESLDAMQSLAENLMDDNARRQIMSANAHTLVADQSAPPAACNTIISAPSRQ